MLSYNPLSINTPLMYLDGHGYHINRNIEHSIHSSIVPHMRLPPVKPPHISLHLSFHSSDVRKLSEPPYELLLPCPRSNKLPKLSPFLLTKHNTVVSAIANSIITTINITNTPALYVRVFSTTSPPSSWAGISGSG